MAIPEAIKANFNTLLRAADSGDLALLECTDAKTGEVRYVLTAFAEQDDGTIIGTPFGHLSAGNPYEEYVSPL